MDAGLVLVGVADDEGVEGQGVPSDDQETVVDSLRVPGSFTT